MLFCAYITKVGEKSRGEETKIVFVEFIFFGYNDEYSTLSLIILSNAETNHWDDFREEFLY